MVWYGLVWSELVHYTVETVLCSRSPHSSLSILPSREIRQSLAASCRAGGEWGEDRADRRSKVVAVKSS
jgi:hypothetical protein